MQLWAGAMLDAIVISDIHLGSDNCEAKALVHFLEAIRDKQIPTQKLILNGDVFDSIDFRRLRKQHWKVLSTMRKLSDEIEIIWINGNHDGPAEIISNLIGIDVRDELILKSGNKRIMLLHGHRFDEFIERYPITSKLADGLYRFLQWVDKSHTIARQAKSKSKLFLRCVQKVQDSAIDYAVKHSCDAVCCGHTHVPVAVTDTAIPYYNSGCWTERPCHYLEIVDGRVKVKAYEETIPEFSEEALILPVVEARPALS